VKAGIATLLLRENTNKYKGHLVVCVSIRISGFNEEAWFDFSMNNAVF
jgi:hypothetical protein